MENLHQRMEALILLRKELHKTLRSLEKSCKPLKNHFFLEKQAPDEIITEIEVLELLPSTNLKAEKQSCSDCLALPIEEINSFEHRSLINEFPINADMMVIWRFYAV
jgi:hypothetical protein